MTGAKDFKETRYLGYSFKLFVNEDEIEGICCAYIIRDAYLFFAEAPDGPWVPLRWTSPPITSLELQVLFMIDRHILGVKTWQCRPQISSGSHMGVITHYLVSDEPYRISVLGVSSEQAEIDDMIRKWDP